jgi:hypothetical protein
MICKSQKCFARKFARFASFCLLRSRENIGAGKIRKNATKIRLKSGKNADTIWKQNPEIFRLFIKNPKYTVKIFRNPRYMKSMILCILKYRNRWKRGKTETGNFHESPAKIRKMLLKSEKCVPTSCYTIRLLENATKIRLKSENINIKIRKFLRKSGYATRRPVIAAKIRKKMSRKSG